MIKKWMETNTVEFVIASTYCISKGNLWRFFFGFRKYYNNKRLMVMSKKDWDKVDMEIKYYYKIVKCYNDD